MTTKATATREQSPSETLNHVVDCRGRLRSAELMTGTPTVTISPSGPTISNKQVNGTTITKDDGTTLIAGKAVTFTVTGLTLDTEYEITISCATDASPAQTIVGTLSLECRA